MRKSFLWIAGTLLVATASAAWSGCYSLSSDCGLLVTCTGGTGGAVASSSSGTTSTGGTATTSSASTGVGAATTSSTSGTTGTGAATTSSASGTTGTGGAPATCFDNKKDGTETDVDCGGGVCMPCAQGKTCVATSDCKTGTCVDGVCCGDASCATCTSCAVPGRAGTCTNLPKGMDDTVNLPQVCESAGTCDGSGSCTGAGTQGHFGDPCSTTASCFNGVCAAGRCKLALGDPCSEDVTCASDRCVGNLCTACAADGDCVGDHCTAAGVCESLGGDPCAAAADCAGSMCITPTNFCVRASSEACTPANCIDHTCPGGNCASCTTSADCPLGTPCSVGGTCLAPPGAFCNQSSECASNDCLPATFFDFARCK